MKKHLSTAIFSISILLAFVLGFACHSAYALAEEPITVSSLDQLLDVVESSDDDLTVIVNNTISITDGLCLGSDDRIITLVRDTDFTTGPMLIVLPSEQASACTLKNLIFDGANISASQEALALYQSSNLESITFKRCVSDKKAGALLIKTGEVSLTNCTFEDNTGLSAGHALFESDSEITLSGCNFSTGSTTKRGGAFVNHGSAQVYNCTFTNNSASSELSAGGALYNMSAVLTEIANCEFTENSANVGGAIFSTNTLSLTDALVYNNKSDESADDIFSTTGLSVSYTEGFTFESEPSGWYNDAYNSRFSNKLFDLSFVQSNESAYLKFVLEKDIEPTVPVEPDVDEPTTPTEPQPDNNDSADDEPIIEKPTKPVDNTSIEKPANINERPITENGKITLDKTKALYLLGYQDALADQNANITRGQIAQILYRLLSAESIEQYYCETSIFADAEDDIAINTLAKAKIVLGYDSKYRPDSFLTRAELLTILSRFSTLDTGSSSFADIHGHWAEEYINICVSSGWLADSTTLEPNEYIGFTEALSLIEKML